MSKLTYEFTNGFLPEKQTSSNGDRIINKKNLNYIYIPSKSPPLYHNLNSVSSNTYSSYDAKLSSNNSNVSSSNESSMLNNSYHSTNDEYVEPQHKPSPVYTPKNYYDQRYTSYMLPNEASISSKRPIKIKNLPTDKARLNETILRNKISDFKPSFNPLNKRHSVNIDSYPSTPRSNLSTPPVQDARSSNEKLLSYEYLSNSNYDKVLNNENFYSDKISEGSYSMLTGSINKDRKAKSINNVSGDYNFVAGNLEVVKGDTVAHTESPLYRKIMSKLSEIPDSMFTKTPPISDNSDRISEPAVNSTNFQEKAFKQKNSVSPKICANMTTNSVKSADDPKFVSLIDVNQRNHQKGPAFKDTKFPNKQDKKTKYKSMYFDPKVFSDDVAPDQKTSAPQAVSNREKVTSQAGDLIYTSMPFYSSSLPKKTSNPTYDINDYLYSDESSKINSELDKVEDNKKVSHENWMRVVGKNEEKPSVNGRGKDSGLVSNKNGINAYIKLIDNSQNKQKNLSSLDDFKSSGPIKYNSFSRKNQIDSSNQLNISDPTIRLGDLNSSFQSNYSNKFNYSLFPDQNFTNSQYKSNDFFKPDMTKKHDLNKSIDNINKTAPKPQAFDLNRTKDTEEIEKAAIFEQSSSFSESISDIDYELLNNSAEFRRKQYKKSRPKNLKIVLSIPDSKNVAKIVSNYPVKSSLQDNKIDEAKSKNQVQEFKYNIDHRSTEPKLSNDFDQEISELTEKMGFKAKDQNRLNDSIENKYPVLMRKISTPPPLPHILESKNKRNTIHGSDNIYMSSINKPTIDESKPASITSAIRDGKTEKPIRVGHGLPPPPLIFSQQNSFASNLNESINKEAKSCDTPRLNESVLTVKTDNSKSDNRRPQLIKNNHVISKIAQRDAGVKNSKKDEKLTTATNLPQLDKIDYVLKTNDDKLLTNIIPYLDDKKSNRNRREQRKLTKNFNLNEYKIDDDTWSCSTNGKNFYESYAKENDRRKKEGNGFLMLLPGIAIPIDTDAADSDESS